MKTPFLYGLLFSLFFFFYNSGFSQTTEIGVMGGVNKSSLYGPEHPALSTQLFSYNAGLFLSVKTSDIASFSTELLFVNKKFEFTNPINVVENGLLTVEESNSYVSIPLLLNFRKGDNVINAFVHFGPEFLVHIKTDRTAQASVNGLEVEPLAYYDYSVNFYDYGIRTGGGIKFRSIVMEAGYFFSLRNLYSGQTSQEMRYINLYLNLGIILNFQPPTTYSRPTTWKSFKYKLKHLF
ncbi:MAG: outer membrane beta-barrel protein [Bacteroidota bacterium]|nr:outer membrane beta-barrel protein [Bacteroidota bacterium]